MTKSALNSVLVVTPHALLGEALVLLLEGDRRISARWVPGLPAADDEATGERPDIVLLDSSMDAGEAKGQSRVLRARWPSASLVLLDGGDAQAARRLAGTVGADGVLSARTPRGDVAEAVLNAGEGPRRLAGRREADRSRRFDQLTSRELEVLAALAAGRGTDDIAGMLDISPHTVRTHIDNAMGRLGAASRLEAIALIREAGNGRRVLSAAPVVRRTGRREHSAGREETASVVIAAEHNVFRHAIRAALENMNEIEVAGEATSVGDLELLLADPTWNVAVIDESVQGGCVAACALVKACDESPRVLVTSRAPDQTVLLAAVEAGADGFLTRGAGVRQLAEAVHRVHKGEASIPPRMLGALLRNLIDRRREEDVAVRLLATLTKRERTVLGLLVEGLDHEQIAARLVVSPHTARTHVQNVLRKLNVHSRLEAVSLITTHNLHERFQLTARAG